MISRFRFWLWCKRTRIQGRWYAWRHRWTILDMRIEAMHDDLDELYHRTRILMEENASLWRIVNDNNKVTELEYGFNEAMEEVG